MKYTLFAVIAIIVIVMLPLAVALAGEASVSATTGRLTPDQTVDQTFVTGQRFMQDAGTQRKSLALERVLLRGLLGMFGRKLDADGKDPSGTIVLKRDTSYLGARDEVTIDGDDLSGTIVLNSDDIFLGSRKELSMGVKLPAATGFSLEPFAGIGKMLWATVPAKEEWSVVYAKAGAGLELKTKGSTIFARGGGLVPIHARVQQSSLAAGLPDQSATPRSEMGAFAEGGVRMGAFTVTLEYEGMKFGPSAANNGAVSGVSTMSGVSSISGVQGGMSGANGGAYQPDGQMSLIFLKIGYSF